MSHYIINVYLCILSFISLQTYTLTLRPPTKAIAYGLYFNLTWISDKGDPTMILITSTNLNTTKSSSLATVNISNSQVLVRIMPDTPASLPGSYRLEAVDWFNEAHVLDTLPPFNLSTVPTVIASNEQKKGHPNSLGGIIGGVLGSLAALSLLMTGFFIHRRNASMRLSGLDKRLPVQTQQEWEARMHNAMTEAQRQSYKMRSHPSSKAHNRLDSATITASVTSDDI